MASSPLRTPRLDLEPVSPEHAEEMVGLLSDRDLYAFYADEPSPGLDELRDRFARWASGTSPDGHETWCTWILRLREGGACAGFVQATVRHVDATAALAWVVGTAYQGRGLAREAAAEVRDAVLAGRHVSPTAAGAERIEAHIVPGNTASEAVARAVGLEPTDERDEDGERLWRLPGRAGISTSRDRA